MYLYLNCVQLLSLQENGWGNKAINALLYFKVVFNITFIIKALASSGQKCCPT